MSPQREQFQQISGRPLTERNLLCQIRSTSRRVEVDDRSLSHRGAREVLLEDWLRKRHATTATPRRTVPATL